MTPSPANRAAAVAVLTVVSGTLLAFRWATIGTWSLFANTSRAGARKGNPGEIPLWLDPAKHEPGVVRLPSALPLRLRRPGPMLRHRPTLVDALNFDRP